MTYAGWLERAQAGALVTQAGCDLAGPGCVAEIDHEPHENDWDRAEGSWHGVEEADRASRNFLWRR